MISLSARHSRAELGPPGGQMGNSRSGGGWETAVKGECARGRKPLPPPHPPDRNFDCQSQQRDRHGAAEGRGHFLLTHADLDKPPWHRPQGWRQQDAHDCLTHDLHSGHLTRWTVQPILRNIRPSWWKKCNNRVSFVTSRTAPNLSV